MSGRGRVVVGLCVAAVGTVGAFAEPPFFVGLGDLPGGSFNSTANGVNADGTVVVGFGFSADGSEAFRWTFDAGMVGLGDLPGGGFRSIANGVSDDGLVVVGEGNGDDGQSEGFRWTAATGMVALSEPGFRTRTANSVSADGSVVVGTGISDLGNEAFRWTQAGGLEGLGDLPGDLFASRAFDVSADGSVVVGDAWSLTPREAYRWTQATGMQGLGSLPDGNGSSSARAISGDGRIISGISSTANGSSGFRWTESEGMQVLGSGELSPRGANADGSVVVGRLSGSRAGLWTEELGVRRVVDHMLALGVATVADWQELHEARDVSDDGLTIVGWGENPEGNFEAWLA